MVEQQFKLIGNYIKDNFKNVENIEEMILNIKNVNDESILSHLPKSIRSFTSQLKLFAANQLAEQCMVKIEIKKSR